MYQGKPFFFLQKNTVQTRSYKNGVTGLIKFSFSEHSIYLIQCYLSPHYVLADTFIHLLYNSQNHLVLYTEMRNSCCTQMNFCSMCSLKRKKFQKGFNFHNYQAQHLIWPYLNTIHTAFLTYPCQRDLIFVSSIYQTSFCL